jgi:hypothetical protein
VVPEHDDAHGLVRLALRALRGIIPSRLPLVLDVACDLLRDLFASEPATDARDAVAYARVDDGLVEVSFVSMDGFQ